MIKQAYVPDADEVAWGEKHGLRFVVRENGLTEWVGYEEQVVAAGVDWLSQEPPK